MSRNFRAAVATVLMLAACGGAEPEQVASLEGAPSTTDGGLLSAEDAALAYAECMRESGVTDFEDPQVAADGSIEWPKRGGADKTATDETYEAAAESCKSVFPGSAKDDTGSGTEKSDNMHNLAVCMREQGFDMPDPDPSGGFPAFDKDTPEFAAAYEACAAVFGGGTK
jgi:hypothetical protein